MTILVTGATGFIGRQLCAQLTADNIPVLALMRHPEKQADLQRTVERLGGNGRLVEASYGDLDLPDLGIKNPLPDLRAIVHLGARFAWGMSDDEARRTNVKGSLAVAELARKKGCRLIYVSGFMLENTGHLQRIGINAQERSDTDWTQVYRNAGAYEASKLEAALRVRWFASDHQLDWVEVQPATVAGAAVSGELDPAQPLFNLIDNLARGRLALIPGGPDHWLPLVSVDHLASLIKAAIQADRPPERLLALDKETPKLKGLLGIISTTLERRAPTRHIPMWLLASLLRIPGLSAWMNTSPETLNFIQPARFDTSATEAFMNEQAIAPPPISECLRASALYYKRTRNGSG